MTIGFMSFLLMQSLSLMLDAAVRPRHRHRGSLLRSTQGLILHGLTMTALFGLVLAVSGSAVVAGVLIVALMAVFVTASNAKHAMLGEPLLFSDLALLSALVRHPGFYFTALSMQQKSGLAIGALGLLLALVWLFVPHLAPHLVGAGVLLLAGGLLAVLLRGKAFAGLARTPDIDADLARHGLIATLLLYWRRWRETPNPPMCATGPADRSLSAGHFGRPELVIVIQCESFADPVDLTHDPRHALPGLARARAVASQWGNLGVSGFGAYTMRTEFGVLFGRSEADLGFRRYDPFLTAQSEGSYALSARLGAAGYRCLFVHPHDLRFYGRDQMMPAIGFDRLIGEEHFPPVVPGAGRYVGDRTLGATLRTLIEDAAIDDATIDDATIDDPVAPTLIYAVTMENHGPWMKDRVTGSPGGLDAYLHHVRNSDTMLTELIDGLADTGRSALLVFFGDHRPSIPGVAEPDPVRHTPYVMLRFVDGKPVPARVAGADGRVDLTPDLLHHAILRDALGASVTSA
ncbi:LTA synthase family protein [Sphingomonas sp. M1A8_2b]